MHSVEFSQRCFGELSKGVVERQLALDYLRSLNSRFRVSETLEEWKEFQETLVLWDDWTLGISLKVKDSLEVFLVYTDKQQASIPKKVLQLQKLTTQVKELQLAASFSKSLVITSAARFLVMDSCNGIPSIMIRLCGVSTQNYALKTFREALSLAYSKSKVTSKDLLNSVKTLETNHPDKLFLNATIGYLTNIESYEFKATPNQSTEIEVRIKPKLQKNYPQHVNMTIPEASPDEEESRELMSSQERIYSGKSQQEFDLFKILPDEETSQKCFQSGSSDYDSRDDISQLHDSMLDNRSEEDCSPSLLSLGETSFRNQFHSQEEVPKLTKLGSKENCSEECLPSILSLNEVSFGNQVFPQEALKSEPNEIDCNELVLLESDENKGKSCQCDICLIF